jgi:hypothetical protein
LTDPIAPALAPEEWQAGEAVRGERPYAVELFVHVRQQELRLSESGDDGGAPGFYVGYDAFHALAALALYGQPYGFTWEMVDALEEMIGGYGSGTVGRDGWPVLTEEEEEAISRARAAVAHLAALLPPR